jgi:hypothetical protein
MGNENTDEYESPFGHYQACHIDELIFEAEKTESNENREAFLTRQREWVVLDIAEMIDDEYTRPKDDPLLLGISEGKMPTGYPDNEMVRAGVGVIQAYDARDFSLLRTHLRILDELSVEQLKIVRPESVVRAERPSLRELQGKERSMPKEEIEPRHSIDPG